MPYKLKKNMTQKYTFHIKGMHCNACILLTESEVGDLPYISSVKSDLRHHTIEIEGEFGERTPEDIAAELTALLNKHGYSVSLETGGAIDIAPVDKRVSVILDIKTPASNEEKNMLWGNLAHVKKTDEIKFVLCNRDDYNWAKAKMAELNMAEICPVLFSPSFHDLNATELAGWVLADKLNVRMQIQLHKILWGEKPGV